jgi:hypothetical protein
MHYFRAARLNDKTRPFKTASARDPLFRSFGKGKTLYIDQRGYLHREPSAPRCIHVMYIRDNLFQGERFCSILEKIV